MTLYDTGAGQYVDVGGMMVEVDALRVAEAIKEYDPNLEILCLNPERAEGISEEPFVIAEKGADGVLRPVLRAWILDWFVLERIRLADNQRRSTLDTLLDMEAKNKKEIKQRYQEVRDETKDVVGHIIGMRGSKYTVRDSRTGDLMTFYDDRPATRK